MATNPKGWKIGFKWTKGDASNPTGAIGVDNTSKAIHIADIDDIATDWNVAVDSNPSIYLHSTTNPATEYVKMYHDATDAYINGVGATAMNFQIAGTTEMSLAAAALTLSAPLTVGVDDTGYDVQLFGATAGNHLLWDESADDLLLVGTATQLSVAGTAESTSTTTGSLRTAGGLACVGDFYAGDDIFLTSAAVLNFAAGDVTLTHSAGKLALGGDGAVELDLDGANMDVALPAGSVDKDDLASGIYTIEHFFVTGNTNDFDNQTVKLSSVWSDGTVVRVVYFTGAAIGTSLGIDIVDGGTDGTGTDVIDSCADNLNGVDVNDITTPYALSANDYINVTFDDLTNGVDFTIDIQVKVPLVTAT